MRIILKIQEVTLTILLFAFLCSLFFASRLAPAYSQPSEDPILHISEEKTDRFPRPDIPPEAENLSQPVWSYLLSVSALVLAILIIKEKIPGLRVKWALVILSVLLGGRYLYWRAFHTLNTQDTTSLVISSLLLLASCA